MRALRSMVASVLGLGLFASGREALGQDYTTNFEGGDVGWTFQYLDAATRWKVDNQPLIFVSPDKKLDSMDTVSQLLESQLAATAISPPASFAFVGPRYVQFWCYILALQGSDLVQLANPQHSRMLRLGPDTLTNPTFTWNFWLSTTGVTWGNPFGGGSPATEISCPAETWHKHIISTTAAGLPSGPGIVTTVITEDPEKLEEIFILRADFRFRHDMREMVIAVGGGGAITDLFGVNVYWAIDNLRVSQYLTDPFGPEPHLPSARGETGGSSEGCGQTSIELFRPSGGPGPGPGGLLFLLALAAALWPLRLRLSGLRLVRRPLAGGPGFPPAPPS